MTEDTTNGMRSLRLEYNGEFVDVLLDEETYSQCINNENVQNQYIEALFESNFVNNKRKRLEQNEEDSLQLSVTNHVDPNSIPGCSKEKLLKIHSKSQQLHPKTLDNEFKWNNDSIKLLLNIRLGMEKEFCMPSCKKKKLWEKVADQLNGVIGSNRVSSEVCDSKYRNLLGTYRVNKRKQNQTGEGAIKWDFFNLMDEVLGYKASSAPPSNFLGSSVKLNSSIEAVENSDDESTTESNASFTLNLPQSAKKKKNEEISLKRYLYLKLQKDEERQREKKEREEKKWEEKKQLKLKEIEAINSLSAAIANASNSGK